MEWVFVFYPLLLPNSLLNLWKKGATFVGASFYASLHLRCMFVMGAPAPVTFLLNLHVSVYGTKEQSGQHQHIKLCFIMWDTFPDSSLPRSVKRKAHDYSPHMI